MKNRLLILVLTLGSALNIFSQDYGVQWIQSPTPTTVMDFRNDTIQFHFINDTIDAFNSTANICDKQGNFLFFTNGILVFDRNGDKMPGGIWLSYYKPSVYLGIVGGLPTDQGVMILPKPGSNNLYYIFHYATTDTSFLYLSYGYTEPTHFYYSVVDMNARGGLGDVVQKDVRLPLEGVSCTSKMTAVKHANGRDWWIIRHGWLDNTYIKFLLTPDSVLGPYFQSIGPPYNYNNIARDYQGNSVFNTTGTQMASVSLFGPTVVLDFDRCSGEFSNPLVIKNKLSDTTILGGNGLALSPSGRFLYINDKFLLTQYDLWSATPNDSIRIFYTGDSLDYYFLHHERLAPNGKIYISSWHGGSQHLHVINHPDSLGLACGFQFNGQQCVTYNTNNLPNMVNYKLGALVGSGCDTVIATTSPQTPEGGLKDRIQVYPNPANEYFVVETNIKDALVTVTDALGHVVLNSKLETENIKLNCATWASGVYFVTVKTKNHEQYSTKFAVHR